MATVCPFIYIYPHRLLTKKKKLKKSTYTYLEKYYSGAGNLYKILRKCRRSISSGVMVILLWSPDDFQPDNKIRLAVMYWTGNMMLWMAVSAEIHPVHNDEDLWMQQFVMHIICRGGDLLESWVTVKPLLLCSTDVVGTQFTFHYFPSFQSICASLRSYINQTKLMPEFTPTTTELSFPFFSWSFLRKQEVFGSETPSVES